jgi:Cof subfamily protein (haloacid dehalogenase superfamily)
VSGDRSLMLRQMRKEYELKNKIKAMVLDIDGVIVGDKEGINFPHPSKKVIAALRKIHDAGIPVSLLTARPSFAAFNSIKAVGIDNPHIADGGATIYNPMRDQVIHTTPIKPKEVVNLLRLLPKDIYVNLFGLKKYYLQKSHENDSTKIITKFLGDTPVRIENLENVAEKETIIKINIIAFSEKEKEIINSVFKNLSHIYSFNWSSNPVMSPLKVLVVTARGVSKRSGVEYFAKYLGVSLDTILGVGDMIQDWDFIEICGYKAAMKNASKELKEKIDIRDPRQTIGGQVNDDGILDVFRYFKLLD